MRARGFTLIELVVSIVLSAMIVGFIATLMTSPVDAYVDQSERAMVSASSEVVSRRLRADLASALPKSVRIRNAGGRSIVEMLHAPFVSQYIPSGTHTALGLDDEPQIELAFGSAGDTFTLFTKPGIENPQPAYLVIGHEGAGTANDAYALGSTAVAIEDEFEENDPGQYQVTLPGTSSFAPPSGPDLRAYWVSSPIAYVCNPTAGTIHRYSGYAITASMPTSEASSQLSGAAQTLVAENVADCTFTCDDEGGSEDVCDDILILQANLQRSSSSNAERLKVFQQISLRDDP